MKAWRFCWEYPFTPGAAAGPGYGGACGPLVPLNIGDPLYEANGVLACDGDIELQPTNVAPSKDAPTIPAATSNLTRSWDSLMTRISLVSNDGPPRIAATPGRCRSPQ